MVMQAAADSQVGGQSPGVALLQRGYRRHLPTRIPTADLTCCSDVCYHSTSGCVIAACRSTTWSLLSENL